MLEVNDGRNEMVEGLEVVDGCALGETVIGTLEGTKEGVADGTEVGQPPSGSPTNTLASTIVISDEETQSRRMHKAKAYGPIVWTDDGMETEVREVQEAKA